MTSYVVNVDDVWSKVYKTETCWIWIGSVDAYGYGRYAVKKNGKWTHVKAHHLIMILTGHPRPRRYEIDHTCVNPICVNPDHLEWVTHAENMRRKFTRTLTCKRGHPWSEQIPYVKLDKRTGKYHRACSVCGRGYRDRMKQ